MVSWIQKTFPAVAISTFTHPENLLGKLAAAIHSNHKIKSKFESKQTLISISTNEIVLIMNGKNSVKLPKYRIEYGIFKIYRIPVVAVLLYSVITKLWFNLQDTLKHAMCHAKSRNEQQPLKKGFEAKADTISDNEL